VFDRILSVLCAPLLRHCCALAGVKNAGAEIADEKVSGSPVPITMVVEEREREYVSAVWL
jgi:hypothetical protein